MGRDQVRVRTPQDKEREEHEEKLVEQIRLENRNPLQEYGERLWDLCGGVYSNYLYSSGTLLLLFSLWTVYPSFVRYRHSHIKRYRRDQLVFRRWFFSTVHMPKWDKKHLQRIVIPPPPQPQEQPDLYFSAASAASGKLPSTATGAVTPTAAENDPATMPLGGLQRGQGGGVPEEENPFSRRELSTRQSAKAAFHSAFESESARAINKALMDINDTVYNRKGQFRREVDEEVDLADVKSRVEWAIKKGKACVVMRQDHSTLRTIPPGWEVWWVSAEEEQRRNMCKYWLMVLVFCRAMQDMLDMPDMPQMIQ